MEFNSSLVEDKPEHGRIANASSGTHVNWTDLVRDLDLADSELSPEKRLRALRVRLQASAGEDTETRLAICGFVARVLSPVVRRADKDDGSGSGSGSGNDDDHMHSNRSRAAVMRRCRLAADDGIAVLERVLSASEAEEGGQRARGPGLLLSVEKGSGAWRDAVPGTNQANQTLFALVAMADVGQPWTTAAAAAASTRLLRTVFKSSDDAGPGTSRPAAADGTLSKSDWLVEAVLQGYLRPLFAQSRPATITSSGRKAAYGSAVGGTGSTGVIGGSKPNTESPRVKPWKYNDLRAISVFAWAVAESDASLIQRHWPLFTPVLLTLLDDPDTPIRARGLHLLQAFVAKTTSADGHSRRDTSSLLHRTGLDSVLANAVFPTLLFLPRLTPEAESLQLLEPAYGALLALAVAIGARRETGGDSSDKDNKDDSGLPATRAAEALLDRILREGIYTAYFHVQEHIRIVELLARQSGLVVQAMGLQAVKHLKDIIPMYAGILTDPFAMRYKPAVVAVVEALQAAIANCWPRLVQSPWQEETIKMLILCWLTLWEDGEAAKTKAATTKRESTANDEADRTAAAQIRTGLVRAADMLTAAMDAGRVDVAAAVGPLVARDDRLRELFRTGS